MTPIQVVIGPTAVGKSDFALTLAQSTGAHIISADAIQVYKGMDIGSAKLPIEERRGIPHHLIDTRTPENTYSVADFLEECRSKVAELQRKNTPIVICGGTALYVRSFLHNYEFAPKSPNDAVLRDELNHLYETGGIDALVALLENEAPERLALIDTHNPRRVQRAIEQHRLGISIEDSTRHAPEPRNDCKITGLNMDRDALYERINRRVDHMIEIGLIDEVESLLKTYPKDTPALTALGYKECIQFLSGSIHKSEMIELIKQKTRNFAKRQLTWYRKFSNVTWIQIP
ncbi:MAG: tRNA (adenosine(37)-N6)-dimethylallyltransferase MiaA [bacterium]|nr:tRNA (adenosine(37)-N6)-dimethylallyltransferase MiaA [bacterium]